MVARGREAERAGGDEAGWKKFSSLTDWERKPSSLECNTLTQGVGIVLVGKD